MCALCVFFLKKRSLKKKKKKKKKKQSFHRFIIFFILFFFFSLCVRFKEPVECYFIFCNISFCGVSCEWLYWRSLAEGYTYI